jgi:hypothetical protein
MGVVEGIPETADFLMPVAHSDSLFPCNLGSRQCVKR